MCSSVLLPSPQCVFLSRMYTYSRACAAHHHTGVRTRISSMHHCPLSAHVSISQPASARHASSAFVPGAVRRPHADARRGARSAIWAWVSCRARGHTSATEVGERHRAGRRRCAGVRPGRSRWGPAGGARAGPGLAGTRTLRADGADDAYAFYWLRPATTRGVRKIRIKHLGGALLHRCERQYILHALRFHRSRADLPP